MSLSDVVLNISFEVFLLKWMKMGDIPLLCSFYQRVTGFAIFVHTLPETNSVYLKIGKLVPEGHYLDVPGS